MAGRSQVLKSSQAYAALPVGGKLVLKVIEVLAGRGAIAITLDRLMERCDLCRSSVRCGIRQIEELNFVTIEVGHRRASLFKLSDSWKSVDANEAARRVGRARLPTPPRASSAPPKPVRQVKAPVEQPRTVGGGVPSMPAVAWRGCSGPLRGPIKP